MRSAAPTPASTADEIAQLRAEVRVLGAIIANMAAHQASTAPLPGEHLGAWTIRLLGFAEAATRGQRPALAARTSLAVERMVQWAENYLKPLLRPQG